MQPGAYPGMTPDAYHADRLPPEPSLSNSIMGELLRSPAHAWTAHPRLNPDWRPRTSDAFDLGSATHTAILGKGAGPVMVDAADWRGKDAREQRDAIRAAGGIPLLPDQFEAVRRMRNAVQNMLMDYGLGGVFADPDRNEVPHFARIGDVWCRAMPDCWHADGWLYDLKTTRDADPDALKRSVAGYGYARQAAHYVAVCEAATGRRPKGMRFVFVETAPPHEGVVVQLVDDVAEPDDWGETARQQCKAARETWRACLDADEWPGYRREIMQIGAPAWHAMAEADRLAARAPAPRKEKPGRKALATGLRMQAPL